MASMRYPFEAYELILRDGLPRVRTDEVGGAIQLVGYLDGDVVRTMTASEWVGPLPVEPTPAESRAAIAAREAGRVAAENALAARKARLRADAASSVGKDVATLRQPESNALLALVLARLGALDDEGRVKALDLW